MKKILFITAFLLSINLFAQKEFYELRTYELFQSSSVNSFNQYFEKALQTLSSHPLQTEYITTKKAEVETQLSEITDALKNTNAKDAAKKAKDEEDDLDLLFQPKKKW